MSAVTVPYVLDRLPQTDDELYELVRTIWGYTIPRTPVCPDHSTPFQFFADAFFARHPVMVLHGSRALAGKSRTLAILGLTEAAVLGADVNILGGSGEQSRNVHDAMHAAWDHELAPRWLLAGEPTQYETRLTSGSKVKALLASSRSVRGPHPQRLRLDEIDEMDVPILDAALGQPMPNHKLGIETQTVLSSTLHYPDGPMIEMMERAADKGWPVHTWCIASGQQVSTHRGDVPIELVREDDLVLTRAGWRPIQHVTFMGYKETLRLTLANGRELVCTPDHVLHTPSGWVRASEADAVTTVGPDVPPVPAALLATGGAVLVEPAPALVLAGGDPLQVLEADARSVATEMVDVVVTDVISSDMLPDVAVGVGSSGLTVDGETLEGVPSSQRTVPQQTGLLESDLVRSEQPQLGSSQVVRVERYQTQPVWDIGVEGEHHEFVVEGVLVHNCYRESMNKTDGWLRPSDVERMKQTVTSEMWRVEFELGEPSSGNRAIDSQAVEEMFRKELGEYDRKTSGKEMWLPVGRHKPFEEPDKHGDYITGVDWAKEKDFTVVSTYRVDGKGPWRLVAYGRFHRQPWPMMVNAVNKTVNAYGGLLCHDQTGIGNVVNDLIDYERRLIKGEIMSGRHRQDMLTEYINAVEKGHLEAPRITSAYTEHLYCSFGDIYEPGKSENHLPDSVASGALAWSRRRRTAKRAGPVPVGTRAVSPWHVG